MSTTKTKFYQDLEELVKKLVKDGTITADIGNDILFGWDYEEQLNLYNKHLQGEK